MQGGTCKNPHQYEEDGDFWLLKVKFVLVACSL